MIYKKVETKQEREMFDHIWIQSWVEEGYELEFAGPDAERFLVTNKLGQFVGSLELKPFTADSAVNEVFDFHAVPLIQKYMGNVVEIDKLSIVREHRGVRNLDRVLFTIVQYGLETNATVWIALIEPQLMIALRKVFGIKVEAVGERFFYKGDDVIPVCVDFIQFRQNMGSFQWLTALLGEQELPALAI